MAIIGRGDPLPIKEDARLKARRSYGVLDTAPEAEYEDIVRLASYICQAPISAISLLEQDRKWFKAYLGPGKQAVRSDLTFCREAMRGEQVFIVPNAMEDERFRTSPTVTGRPHIRFYAGAPLITRDGFCLGVLCVADKRHRKLRDDQVEALGALARQVVQQFELRKSFFTLNSQSEALRRQAIELEAANSQTSQALAEAKESMRALLASERRFSAIVKSAMNAIVTIDADGVIQGWDGQAESMFGWKTHEILLQPFSEFLMPQRRTNGTKSPLRFGKNGLKKLVGQRVEATALRKSGEEFPTEIAVSEVQVGAGLGFTAFISDLTAQKKAEAALSEIEVRHSTIAMNVPGVVYQFVLHKDGTCGWRYVSKGSLEVFGIAPDRLESDPHAFFNLVHPEDLPALRQATADSAKSLTPFSWAGRLVRPDGQVRWISATSKPRAQRDRAIVWDGVITDITDQKLIQEELRDIEDRFKSFVESAGDAFFLHDQNGQFVEVNRTACEALGYSREELQQMRVQDIDCTCDCEMLIDAWNNMEPGVPLTIESAHKRKDGSMFPVEVRIQLFQWRGQNYVSALARDTTDRKRLEEEERAKQEAERANLAKSQFLSRMSHELRTPLNSVLGFAQLLDMQAENERQRECVAQITRGGRHLLNLINEVLDISRIESGDMHLSLESVSIDELVSEAVALVVPLASKRSVGVVWERSGGLGKYVLADKQRLLQVLINLLSNAVKYNFENGKVVVRVGEGPDGFIRLEVTDTGPGISAEMLPKLFTPFERLGIEQSSVVEGTGLGLALSKRLAEAMGGAIGVDVSWENGSCFQLDLQEAKPPLTLVQGAESEDLARASLPYRARILYVEDNLANVCLMQQIMAARPGFELLVATGGEAGWQRIEKERPDLVLLDLDLPDVGGSQILDRVLADPALRSIPVVVVSADATEQRIEALLKAGARGYVTKPFDINGLLETVDALLEERENRCA